MSVDKTRQDRTRQDQTRQDNTTQHNTIAKTIRNDTRQDHTRQATIQYNTQNKTKQDKRQGIVQHKMGDRTCRTCEGSKSFERVLNEKQNA